MIDGIRQVARGCGYAVGVHGTQARDLDLIACPWVHWAIPAASLIRALCVALDLDVAADEHVGEAKSHGRLGWLLVAFPHHDDLETRVRMIDLSVMPVVEQHPLNNAIERAA